MAGFAAARGDGVHRRKGHYATASFFFRGVLALAALPAFGVEARLGFSAASSAVGASVTPSRRVTLTVMWQVRLLMRDTRPRARARQRLIVGPSSTNAAETTSSSPSQFRF